MPAPRHWIEFVEDWRAEPMAYWVHVEQEVGLWCRASRYLPSAPAHIPHKGFAVLCVEFGTHVLRFSSAAQLDECIRVLSMKPLPTSRQLPNLRVTSLGPNGHWLSRLPVAIKSGKARGRVVMGLEQTRAAIVGKSDGWTCQNSAERTNALAS